MVRLRDFGVAERADESAGRVEANPGKLLRLWARSPVGLTATDDRSFFDLFFTVRGAMATPRLTPTNFSFFSFSLNANPSTFSSATPVQSATLILTNFYHKAYIN